LLIKKSFVGFGRDGTGVARGLSLVWCVLCSLSLCLLLLPFCRSTPLYISAPEGFNRGFAPTIRYYPLIYARKGLGVSFHIIEDKTTTSYFVF